jgi:hypothetical protein
VSVVEPDWLIAITKVPASVVDRPYIENSVAGVARTVTDCGRKVLMRCATPRAATAAVP